MLFNTQKMSYFISGNKLVSLSNSECNYPTPRPTPGSTQHTCIRGGGVSGNPKITVQHHCNPKRAPRFSPPPPPYEFRSNGPGSVPVKVVVTQICRTQGYKEGQNGIQGGTTAAFLITHDKNAFLRYFSPHFASSSPSLGRFLVHSLVREVMK